MSVRKGLVLLLAVSALMFLAACGGSSTPSVVPPPSGGFSASNLSGTYVVSISGFDFTGSGSSFAIAGTLTANGSGSLTGLIDVNDAALGASLSGASVQTGLAVTGNYTVSKDGRGAGTITFTFDGVSQRFGIDFVITQNGSGLITRFDGNGTGSGTLDMQTTASQSSLTALAFSLAGADSGGLPLATVGGFTLDASGNITAGSEDFNDDGGSSTDLALTGTLVLSSGTSGTAAFTTASGLGALSFDAWVIDSTHIKLIETDLTGNVLSGDAFSQQASVTPGNFAYTLAGFDSAKNPFVAGGLMTAASGGGLTGIEDFNDSGVIGSESSVSGSCTLSAGRCQIAFSGFSNGNGSLQTFQFAAYPSSGGILLLEVDNLGLTMGAALAQSSTALAAPQGYGLNLTGIDLNTPSEVDDIAEFTAQTVGTNGSGSLNGIIDINDGGPATPSGGASLGSSSYTPDSPATGRGMITATNGFGLLEYYTVDGSTALFIDGDPTQVAVGTIALQNSATSPAAIGSAGTLLRQASQVHPALRRPKNKK